MSITYKAKEPYDFRRAPFYLSYDTKEALINS